MTIIRMDKLSAAMAFMLFLQRSAIERKTPPVGGVSALSNFFQPERYFTATGTGSLSLIRTRIIRVSSRVNRFTVVILMATR